MKDWVAKNLVEIIKQALEREPTPALFHIQSLESSGSQYARLADDSVE